ncbi:MAG: hypothetical protein JRN58_05220 [Nitrososphaerota archaeon]|nr:hypothetical protein [Nitrososphaerota archaeon]
MSVKMRVFAGKLSRKNESWTQAQDELQINQTEFTPPEKLMGDQNTISPYHPLFDKGADIYPRNLWFMKIEKHDILGLSEAQPAVHSDEDIKAKTPWDKVRISGPVERQFLFATALGDDLIPFGILHYKSIVLPVIVERGRLTMIEGPAKAQSLGYPALSNYLRQVEESWQSLGKDKKLGLYQWLDFRRKLTRQNPTTGYKVIYTGSATYLTAAAIDMKATFSVAIDGTPFQLSHFIAESKTYQFETQDRKEAMYLAAVLNSTVVDDAIKPLQTRGLFGARDIHKRPLTLPIPKFDETNSTHQSLAELGDQAHKRISINIGTLQEAGTIGRTRAAARKLLSNEIASINRQVSVLLKR